LIFLFYILSFFFSLFSQNSPTAAISASVPERGRMVVVVQFPDPDDACRCSHDLATASEFSRKP
jgi:hypothetical protein